MLVIECYLTDIHAELHIVAIDLPGHGQSSHRPVGAQYNVFEYVLDLKYVVDGKCRF